MDKETLINDILNEWAMRSPDGSHVLVGVASETKSGDKHTLKVSTYDLGAGRKSPGGEHYASSYDVTTSNVTGNR